MGPRGESKESATNKYRHQIVFCAATLLALVGLSGCENTAPAPAPSAPLGSPAQPTGAPDAAGQAPEPSEPRPQELDLAGFDPVAACAGTLDVASIPPVDVIGQLPDREGVLTKFEMVDGRFERGVTGASVRLAGQKLRACSPFAADGSIPTAPRFTAATTSLEVGSWTWPSADLKRWRYWNHVLVTQGQPWTSHGGPADKGLLVVDEVDDNKRRVKGRALLCLEGGGWLAGTFDLQLCDK